VAGRVGKQIENDEIVDAAMNDQPFGIMRPIFPNAKDTGRGFPPA
jgi:hypothetical protein